MFFISSAVFASDSPQSNCTYEASVAECTTYGRSPLSELQLIQLGQMNAQAAYAEYQRALASEREKLRMISEQARQSQSKEARVQACLSNALANKNACITGAENALRSHNGTCHWISAGGVAAAVGGFVAAVPTFGWGAAVGAGAAVSFGTAATICYINADGAYSEDMNECSMLHENQVVNSCGRIQ